MPPQLLSLGKMDRADTMINKPKTDSKMPMIFRRSVLAAT